MRRSLGILIAAALLTPVGSAVAAPTLSHPAVFPEGWINLDTAGGSWVQSDVPSGFSASSEVQINTAPDESPSGEWLTRWSTSGFLHAGLVFPPPPGFSVLGFEGRHLVRVVVPGAVNSPLILGTLLLDRTPPAAISPGISTAGETATIAWTQDDAGLSGTDPAVPLAVEVNASGAGDQAGAWLAVDEPPAEGGDGRRAARTDTRGLIEGDHLVRVRSRDLAGNEGARSLGTLTVDRRAPVVTGVRVTREPGAGDATAEIAFSAEDPAPGSGIAPGTAVQAVGLASGLVLGETPWSGAAEGRVVARLPGPGTHQVVIRVADRSGRVGQSAPLQVLVPAGAARAGAEITPLRVLLPGGEDPDQPAAVRGGAGARWAYAAIGRVHERRGLRLRARLVPTATAAEWRRVTGAGAARMEGWTTVRGTVAVAPATTRALDALRRAALRRTCGGGPCLPARADQERMVGALAVLLHETLHVTGPQPLDARATASGRALEEGLTEAAAADLLPSAIGELGLRPALRRALLARAAGYRPAYGAQVRWVRAVSARATAPPWRGPAARAWRLEAADRWGAERWARLARALGTDEAAARAAVPPLGGTPTR